MWTEEISAPSLSHSNYISGAATYLQSLHYGYGGFRVYPDRLEINPVLPPRATAISYVGVDYLGNTLDIHLAQDNEVTVILTECTDQHQRRLKLMVYNTEQIYSLQTKIPVRYQRSRAQIYVQFNS